VGERDGVCISPGYQVWLTSCCCWWLGELLTMIVVVEEIESGVT